MDKETTEIQDNIKEIGEEILAELARKWDTIGISNDFIFGKIMQDEELLKELVHMILPNLKFKKLVIAGQKTVEIGKDIHGVRFDIFVFSETGETITIEMQVIDTGDLPKRMRYYVSMADSMMLEKGLSYSRLKDSYVILICPSFDMYGKGLHKYTFTNRCKEAPDIEMEDGTTKIVLNAAGTADDVDGKLKAFLDYVAGIPSEDEYVKKLEEAVKKARMNKEWRREYMTLMQRDLENQEIGIRKGIQQGAERRDKEKIAELLKDGRTAEEIADFCKYPVDLIKEVENSLFAVQ